MIDIKTPEEQIFERMAAVEEVVIDLTQKVKSLESFILCMDERISKTEVTKAKNGTAIKNLESSVKILAKTINGSLGGNK
jgi:hypothetical protein